MSHARFLFINITVSPVTPYDMTGEATAYVVTGEATAYDFTG